MKNSWIKVFILLGIVILLYCLSLDILGYFLKKYFPMKRSIALGIGVYYSKFIFSIVMFISVCIWIIDNKKIRILLIILVFILYLIYWSSSINIYPYRIFFLLFYSLFMYISLHLCIRYILKR